MILIIGSGNIRTMEDARWLRLVTIGLVLAAIAAGYFLVAQRFTGNTQKSKSEVSMTQSPSPDVIPSSVLGTQNGETPKSAYERIAERTRGGVSELPATGFPAVLTGILAVSAMIAGFGLRKFPK